METIRIPSPDELESRLTGLDALLTASKWQRAAIVYAYTEVGERGRGRFYKPEPPRMHIRTFAEQGYAGLTTNKSVSRYRDAWIKAISEGWASPVDPGQTVNLPDQPFPAWPYGNTLDDEFDADDDDDVSVTYTDVDIAPPPPPDSPRTRRPLEQRVLDHLDSSEKLLSRLARVAPESELDPEVRQELLDRLSALQRQTSEVMGLLRGIRAVS
jgi:hypothetical protein